MAELSGKFQLSDADEDNFDKIMEAVGVSEEKRARGRSMRPTIQYSRNGDDYTMTYITGDGRELAHTFQLGVELDETTMDGRKVLSTYKRDGKNMIQHEKQENGLVIVYEREITGDELHVQISCGDLKAHRVFKKL
ncbi:fatty acid-binding protein-like [Daphnia pulex]|uniref:fatty acid-binding protein-like n=1 Tax=Daphnia pulex TaxID=6669 RepID=UPI001EE081A1|nr:fatty acid-binding protein-like [Daphnia pulex]